MLFVVLTFLASLACSQITPSYVLNESDYESLSLLDDEEEFSLAGETYLAKVFSVTDGDTVKLVLKHNEEFLTFTFRLNGIDTP